MSDTLTQTDLNQAKAFYHGTKALFDFSQKEIVPVLQGIGSRSEHDDALIVTYYRMLCWMSALERLEDPSHFQTVMNAARGIYELFIDLKLLQANPSWTPKFYAFASVEKFRVAKIYSDALKEFPAHPPPRKSTKPDPRLILAADPAEQTKYDDDRRTHWGADKNGKPITPGHWSNLGMDRRAREIGPDEYLRCRHVYAYYSWYVHAGSAAVLGIDKQGLLHAFTWGHATLRTFFIEATKLICDVHKLFLGKPSLREDLEKANAELGQMYAQLEGLFVPRP